LLNSSTNALPEPDEQAQDHSQLLIECIRRACNQQNGWIPFSEYMRIALYEPALGYYCGGLQKFGQQGDFITAPEVSPLFGQCLANQLCEPIAHLKQTGNGEVNLIEFGAGSGLLAADVLLQLEKRHHLPHHYFIIELSAELQQRQKATIEKSAAHLLDCVVWLDHIPEQMDSAVVIANEVLDAMPVECFRVAQKDKGVESLMVGFGDDNELLSCYQPATSAVLQKTGLFQQRSEFHFSENYCSEFNPAIAGWLAEIENSIKNLLIILIDYGYNEKEYFHPDRSDGTLMCYYQHRAHNNFLWWPGIQDITAFVNYTDVAYGAVDCGLDVLGYTTQAAFLLANGLSDLHASQVGDDVQQQVRLSQQIKTLTLPSEMGDRFKVMALSKNCDIPLSGFSMLDLRNRL